jgi:hypothetical protein
MLRRFGRSFLLLPLLILTLSHTACSVRPDAGDLEVTLVNIAPDGSSAGVGEAALRFTIRLQNATPEPVTLTGSAHKIHLNGVYVGQALSNSRIEIPRLSTATEEITVHLSTFKLARAFYDVYRDQRASYRITSTLYGSRSTHRTRKEGSVDLQALRDIPLPAATTEGRAR